MANGTTRFSQPPRTNDQLIFTRVLSPGNEGQVLIFPYIGALGGNDTLISISSQEDAKALKVHFRDRQGNLVLSFNLYLEGQGSWAAALTQTDGQVRLEIPDASCTVPNLTGEGSSVVVPMTSGFLEVIDMGTITGEEILDAVNTQNCVELVNLWADSGLWRTDPSSGISPPNGRLRGSASLINVPQGTMYSFVARALTEFSDIQQHSPPEDPLPDLTSAHDVGTNGGETTSWVCSGMACVEDTWSRPVDAVAAAMMAHELQGEFNNASNIGAETEVVLTFPLRSFYAMESHAFHENPQVLLEIRDRDGRGDDGGARFGCIPELSSFCRGTWSLQAVQPIDALSVDILSFGDLATDAGSVKISELLGEEYTAFFPDDFAPSIPESGTFWLGMETDGPATLQSISGKIYFGVPVLGFALQRYTNGYLLNNLGQLVLANYGSAFDLSTKTRITP